MLTSKFYSAADQGIFHTRNITCNLYLTVSRLRICLLLTPLLFILSASYPQQAKASELTRNQEITECKDNEVVTWGDGRDTSAGTNRLIFSYSHQNCPPWFAEYVVTKMSSRAATAWSECGIDSQAIQWPHSLKPHYNLVTIQWNEKESRGNFALANLTKRTLSLNPKMFELLRTRNPAYDASQTLQMTISHEMGHFFGLIAHSRRCVDVMSYYTNNKGDKCFSRAPMSESHVVEYRNILPTACDIKRCRQINGKPPLPEPSR